MEELEIRKYARLMEELNLTGLEISNDHDRVRLERSANGTAVPAPAPAPVPEAQPVQAEPAGVFTVSSPMVGIFYASSAEGAKPYVKVGDTVKQGDVLCIIEAMKLLNEIAAEQDGVITEICVKNAQTVDYGMPLFKMRRL
ncbi:MAG: acetyl-CoA carboxylase biotin carboxyl carrier protein [Candidatus Onthomonas sp.]|nr:acetyl-CoA carboxylase biotin carboxyl carrier protein [Candidatus Onthomonas sp.]